MMTRKMTIRELRSLAKQQGLEHARFCLEQNATQVGRGRLNREFAELDHLETARFHDAFEDLQKIGRE